MKPIMLSLPAALLLAACGQGESTDFSISSANGSAGISNGVATIDVPGFKGELRLPQLKIDAANLDLNGVQLFPGTTVGNIAVNAAGQNDGRLRIAFDSPATVPQVRQYLIDQFAQAGFKVAADGTGLSGTTADGKPVRVTLNAAGADRARGELAVGN